MTLIIDTGFLYATVDKTDKHHKVATETLDRIQHETLVLPTATVVEVSLIMNVRLGRQVTSEFIAELENSPLLLEPLIKHDFSRIGELLYQLSISRCAA